MVRYALIALLGAGCTSFSPPPCAVRCSSGSCPGALECLADGYCHAAGEGAACGGPDAGPPIPGPELHAVELALAPDHACAIDQAGAVWCWGANDRRQLAGSSQAAREDYARDAQLESGVTDLLAVGVAFGCQMVDGLVLCWGDDRLEQLGSVSTVPGDLSPVPLRTLDLLHHVVAVAAGRAHACLLANEGDDPSQYGVFCWGDDSHGQSSARGGAVMAVTVSSPGPDSVVPEGAITKLAAGDDFSCMQAVGQVICWGDDSLGQLSGTPTSQLATATTAFDRDCDQLVAGGHSLACLVGQHLEVKGRLAGTIDGVSQVALGEDAGCYVATGGELRCWGEGPLLAPAGGNGAVPIEQAVGAAPQAARAWVSGKLACYSRSAGADLIYCWGEGPLGNGPVESQQWPPMPVLTDGRDQ